MAGARRDTGSLSGNRGLAFTDPFGLCPPEPCGKFNAVKAGVGLFNFVRGGIGVGTGAMMVVTGQAAGVLGPVGQAVGIPVTVVGAATMAGGTASARRGAQQLVESVDDPNGPSLRNVLGLAPFGQKYDDPGEPGAVDYFAETYEKLQDNEQRLEVLLQAVKDFFAVND